MQQQYENTCVVLGTKKEIHFLLTENFSDLAYLWFLQYSKHYLR